MRAPKAVWSDGIHYVRPASVKDRHPMRWVVGRHRGISEAMDGKSITRSFSRRAETQQQAVGIAMDATTRFRKANPGIHEATPPKVSGSQREPNGSKARSNQTKISATREAFSVTHFNCIVANPVAQVWQCVSRPGEKKAPGRRKRDGSGPEEAPLRHQPGECAILLGKEPLRDEAGNIRVFPNWVHAADQASDLYLTADPEDRLMWKEGSTRVHATLRIDVIFDPTTNGVSKPFSLYLPEFRRPIYEDRTRPIPGTELGRSKIDPQVNPQAKLDEVERRRKHQQLNREPSFEERPLRFRTIWGAIEEAERREKMMKGMRV